MKKKLRIADIIFICILVVSGIVLSVKKSFLSNALNNKAELNGPWMSTTDNLGYTDIVDNNRARILRVDSDNRIVKEILDFSYIEDVEADEKGNLYVIDTVWNDESFLVGADICYFYDMEKGTVKELCRFDYDDSTKHQLFSMTVLDDEIMVALANSDRVTLYEMDKNGNIVNTSSFDITDVSDYAQDIAINRATKDVYVLDKDGRILEYSYAEGDVQEVFNWKSLPNNAIPYRMDVTSEGRIIITDIKNALVYEIFSGEATTILQTDSAALNIKVSESNNNTYISVTSTDGIDVSGRNFENLKYSIGIEAKRVGIIALLVLCVISVLYILPRIITAIIKSTTTTVSKARILVLISAITVAGIIVFLISREFTKVLRNEKVSQLQYTSQEIINKIDGEKVKALDSESYFYDEDYTSIHDSISNYLNYELDSSTYCDIVKYDENTGIVYDAMFYDDSISTFYPLYDSEADEVIEIYNTGKTLKSNSSTSNGSFEYVKTPIFDSEDGTTVVGVLELGTWGYVIKQQISTMIKKLITQVVAVLVIIIFVFTEVFEIYKLKKEKSETQLHLSRGFVFLIFMAYNLPTAFLPVYVMKMYKNNLNLPTGIANSLPISVNMFLIGLMALLGYKLMKKLSLKRAMIVNGFVVLIGDLTLALASNYYMILGGLLFNGVGVGFLMNMMHIVCNDAAVKQKDSSVFAIYQAGSLSGIMVGMTLGGVLADSIGYSKVFFITSFIWACIIIMAFIFGRKIEPEKEEKENTKKTGMLKFVFSPRIFMFLILMVFVYVMTSSFIYYFVPLYCDANNYSSTVSCIMILLSSVCGIFLSESATKYAEMHLGKAAIYISSAIALGSLLLFALFPTTDILLFALFAMGFGTCFGTSMRLTVFSKFKETEEFGVDKATGIYDMTERAGEAVGPMLFASLMTGTFSKGIEGFVIISVVCGLIYFIIDTHKNRRRA